MICKTCRSLRHWPAMAVKPAVCPKCSHVHNSQRLMHTANLQKRPYHPFDITRRCSVSPPIYPVLLTGKLITRPPSTSSSLTLVEASFWPSIVSLIPTSSPKTRIDSSSVSNRVWITSSSRRFKNQRRKIHNHQRNRNDYHTHHPSRRFEVPLSSQICLAAQSQPPASP